LSYRTESSISSIRRSNEDTLTTTLIKNIKDHAKATAAKATMIGRPVVAETHKMKAAIASATQNTRLNDRPYRMVGPPRSRLLRSSHCNVGQQIM